jgi:hypothetical protein
MPTTPFHSALVALSLLAGPALGAQPQSADGLVVLRESALPTTLVWLESSALEPVMRQGFAHPLVKQLLREPLVATALKDGDLDLVARADALQALLGRSPFAFAHALSSGGFAAGFTDVTPGSEAPFLLLRGEDPDEMEDAIDELESLLRGFQLLSPVSAQKPRLPSKSVRRSWHIAQRGSEDKAAYAAWTRDGTLVITTKWDHLVDWCRGPGQPSPLVAARDAEPSSTSAFAWFDLDGIERQADLKELRAMAADPGTHFVLGPAIAYAGLAKSVSASLVLNEGVVSMGLRADGVALEKGAALFPAESPRPMRVRTDSLGDAQLHRDFGTLLFQRTELFPPRAQPAFAEGLSNLALLVGGPDALDDLLEAIQPTLRLHALDVDFPANATPDVPLPGLNVVATLSDPELNGGRLNSAFQAAISLTNLEAAMQGREALRLGLEMVDGVTLTTAKLAPPAPGSSVDLRFNFSPGCALVEDDFVFGTRHEGVMEFIGKNAEPLEPLTPSIPRPWISVDHLSVSGEALATLATDQRDLLVMRAVLEDGKPQARAEAEADILLRLLHRLDRIQFGSYWRKTGASERSLRADLAFELKQ